MFYTNGLSFHLARNPHYRNSYLRASTLPGYVLFVPNKIRPTTLVQQENRHIERCLQPIKSTWSTKGVICRAAGLLIEARYPNIFWTPCVVHTLNLALKSICSPKQNDDWYDKCSWISEIDADIGFINFFIVNHNMRLTMYKDHCKLKLLSIAETRFAYTLVMIRRFKEVKEGLEQMVISPNWSLYKEDDVGKARAMIRMADIDKPYLHLVYE
ncbi:unnamed protein product [Prunus brigantina]